MGLSHSVSSDINTEETVFLDCHKNIQVKVMSILCGKSSFLENGNLERNGGGEGGGGPRKPSREVMLSGKVES